MTLLDELHYLISALRLHIAQEYPRARPKPKLTSRQEIQVEPKVFQPKEVKIAPPKVHIKLSQEPQPQHPLLSALALPFAKPTIVPLADCIEKLEKLHIKTIDQPEEVKAKDFGYPQLAILSFFAPGSSQEQFLQKVASACNERLCRTQFYTLPSIQQAAEIHTFSSSRMLKAIFVAYDVATQSKANSWLMLFGGHHFDTRVHELVVPSVQDVAYKSWLWKALQAAI